MFIQYAEFHLYERFLLNDIKTLKLSMTEVVQIILGTNGSGKTSLVEELTPLPASRDMFLKGGYKIIECTHEGDVYRLSSVFTDGQSHSCIKNGVQELNSGGTLTEQRQLVKKLFNITPELHSLMMGEEKFTTMSPARRREWYTKLNDNNYNYCISIYKKAIDGQRDASGALKILKKRLADEASKRIDENTINEIKRKLKALTEESQKLYALKNTDVQDSITVGQRVNAQSKVITDLDKQFRSLRRNFIKESEYDHREINEIIEELTRELSAIDGKYESLSTTHVELVDKLSMVKDVEGVSTPELVRSIAALKKTVQEITDRCTRNIQYKDHSATLNALNHCYETMVSVFTELPADNDNSINRENYERLTSIVEKDSHNLSTLKSNVEHLSHKIEHYEQLKLAGAVECPSCKFNWIRDFDQKDYNECISAKEKLLVEITKLQNVIATNKQVLQDMVSYQKLLDPYLQISRHNRSLSELCSFINSKNIVKTAPRQVLTILEIEKANLNEFSKTIALNAEIQEKLHSLQIARKSKESNIELIRSQLQNSEKQLGELVALRSETIAKLDSAKQYRAKLVAFSNIGEQIEIANDRLQSTMTDFADAIRNELIDKMLTDTHSTIAVLHSSLNEIESQEALVADIQYQISALELDEKAWQAVAKSLSPVDGLIAEGMLGFIRRFVATMNALIAKVWSYSLVIKDCSLDENSAELNYKFPLFVAGRDKPTPDVLKSSSGQRDMIDLAFVITAMYRSGLEGYPLILDEFGKAFDEEHRDASTRVISDIIDQLGFKQIFMISHYESCWGAFNKAQVCVIDKRNITLPKHIEYNKHVQFIT